MSHITQATSIPLMCYGNAFISINSIFYGSFTAICIRFNGFKLYMNHLTTCSSIAFPWYNNIFFMSRKNYSLSTGQSYIVGPSLRWAPFTSNSLFISLHDTCIGLCVHSEMCVRLIPWLDSQNLESGEKFCACQVQHCYHKQLSPVSSTPFIHNIVLLHFHSYEVEYITLLNYQCSYHEAISIYLEQGKFQALPFLRFLSALMLIFY